MNDVVMVGFVLLAVAGVSLLPQAVLLDMQATAYATINCSTIAPGMPSEHAQAERALQHSRNRLADSAAVHATPQTWPWPHRSLHGEVTACLQTR